MKISEYPPGGLSTTPQRLLTGGRLAVRIITGMDRNAPEWASITGMDIKINLFYAPKFIILPKFILKFQFLLTLHLLKCI